MERKTDRELKFPCKKKTSWGCLVDTHLSLSQRDSISVNDKYTPYSNNPNDLREELIE